MTFTPSINSDRQMLYTWPVSHRLFQVVLIIIILCETITGVNYNLIYAWWSWILLSFKNLKRYIINGKISLLTWISIEVLSVLVVVYLLWFYSWCAFVVDIMRANFANLPFKSNDENRFCIHVFYLIENSPI